MGMQIDTKPAKTPAQHYRHSFMGPRSRGCVMISEQFRVLPGNPKGRLLLSEADTRMAEAKFRTLTPQYSLPANWRDAVRCGRCPATPCPRNGDDQAGIQILLRATTRCARLVVTTRVIR